VAIIAAAASATAPSVLDDMRVVCNVFLKLVSSTAIPRGILVVKSILATFTPTGILDIKGTTAAAPRRGALPSLFCPSPMFKSQS
jgi:hypothetical protein